MLGNKDITECELPPRRRGQGRERKHKRERLGGGMSAIPHPYAGRSTHDVCVILKLSLLFHLFLFIIVDISFLLDLWDRSLLLPDEATICFD